MEEKQCREKEVVIPPEAAGVCIADWLRENGYFLLQPCGGRGSCGKCRVKDSAGNEYLACRTAVPEGGLVLRIPDNGGIAAGEGASNEGRRGGYAALDLGTTTLALAVPDGNGGFVTASCLNTQASFGADVLSRICACSEGHLKELQNTVISAVNGLLKKTGSEKPEVLYVAGNPAMLHILCGVSPEGIGRFPFTPEFTALRTVDGPANGLNAGKAVLLPSASAYIGSDITAGAVYCGLESAEDTVLFIDIGTNGETLLCHRGSFYGASAAAGPALEGAGISCGTGGIEGAVSKVYCDGGKLKYGTIGGAAPSGLCGSGLVDLIACLLDAGIIDETGFMEDGDYTLCEGITLTQKDVRQFQLAQSAVHACILTLLAEAGIEAEEVSRVLVAGGLGYYINPVSAIKSCIFPKKFAGKLQAVGNTSLMGAAACCTDRETVKAVDAFARRIKTVDLNSSPVFAEKFIEKMTFEGN